MKKALVLFLLLIVACTKQENNSKELIFTSNYPLKLIIQGIVGDSSIVFSIVPPNVSEHTFEPKVSDVNKLDNAKIVFYVADNLDKWATKSISNKIQVLKLLPENEIYLFEDGKTPDPHFWTSPKTVLSILDTLTTLLVEKLPEYKQKILESSRKFKSRLFALDDTIKKILSPLRGKYVFTFHPSFRYFLRDYGLIYGGSIEETPGAEPTLSHLNNIIQKIKQTQTKAIFTEPQLNPHSAEVIANSTGVRLFELDPIGNPKITTYDEFVLKNVKTILFALQ
ncbi:MAG: metal ABC transporter substrate-binding protein [Candidatus Kapaibacteriota bacterium]|jgi:zinc transport system substrate-binding protein